MVTTSPDIIVSRLRVSYLKAAAHTAVQEIGDPDTFESYLLAPRSLRGLDLTLPWIEAGADESAVVTREFWTNVVGGRIDPPTTVREAARLRRSAVPLRYSGSLGARVTTPRLEVFLHPFGWVSQATVDLVLPKPQSLPDIPATLAAAEAGQAEIRIGTVTVPTTVGSVMDAASAAVGELVGDPSEVSVEGAAHRLVSVIDATSTAPPDSMPAAASPLHLVVHRLSAGGAALPAPQVAFVPRWEGGSFVWAPAELVYVLSRGTSVLTRTSFEPSQWNEQESSSRRHRRLSLLIAHVSASAALVRAGKDAEVGFLRDWARLAADRLGRLYGPAPAAADYWGLEAQHLIKGIGADQDVETLGHAALTARHTGPTIYP